MEDSGFDSGDRVMVRKARKFYEQKVKILFTAKLPKSLENHSFSGAKVHRMRRKFWMLSI